MQGRDDSPRSDVSSSTTNSFASTSLSDRLRGVNVTKAPFNFVNQFYEPGTDQPKINTGIEFFDFVPPSRSVITPDTNAIISIGKRLKKLEEESHKAKVRAYNKYMHYENNLPVEPGDSVSQI